MLPRDPERAVDGEPRNRLRIRIRIRIRVGEGHAARVLLMGNGVLHSWGVRLRELSARGHLADLLHRGTGRALALGLVGEERMNAASAVDWLGDAATRGHDVAVVCVGLNDALRLTPLPKWRGHMTRLLDRPRADQWPDARIRADPAPWRRTGRGSCCLR